MPKIQSQEHENLEPLKEGEFHRINGIGPGIEKRLHAAGIQTFHQLSALSPDEIAEVLNGLVGVKPDQILRKDWTGQAARYASELENSQRVIETEEPGEPQHYESYLVELLVDDLHTVLRTRITQVKTGEKDGWAGWESGKLDRWISIRSNLQLLPPPQTAEAHPQPERPYLQEQPYRKVKPASREVSRHPKGTLSISKLKLNDPTENRTGRFFDSATPFEMHLSLSVSNMDRTPGQVLKYQANVIARRFSSAETIEAGQIKGQWNTSASVEICIPIQGLPEGIYRLDTFVQVFPEGSKSPERDAVQAISEGEIIQVRAIERDFKA